MEHTIKDYIEGEEKDLVTSSPDPELTNPNIILSNLSEFHSAIERYINPAMCNEVTLTFTDKWIIPYKTEYLQLKIKDFFNRWSKVANYLMVQDYSHVGRLHYHGILEMKQVDKFERLIINLRKTFGRVECKQISFWSSYMKYMTGVYDPSHDKFMRGLAWHTGRYITNII